MLLPIIGRTSTVTSLSSFHPVRRFLPSFATHITFRFYSSFSTTTMSTKPQAKLNLTLLSGTYAVVRLDAGSKPPDWFWESSFYSLTKTDDELSIVCEQNKVPSDICESDQCETGWGLFKVEGPLDFSLTGILNKLTNPLAKAGISIFAVSTYDTDYILVSEKRVFDSGYAWILAGHSVTGLPESRIPVDGHGPVVTFEKDAMIPKMVDLINGKPSTKETFGLVLNAGWVPSEATQTAYREKLLPAVRNCFQESDYNAPASEEIPNVYLYPSQHLHVTVATLHAFTRPTPDQTTKDLLAKDWGDLVKAASRHDEWPRRPLQLTLQSAQIGKRAGILLWNEVTGGLDQMRICIQAEMEGRQQQLIRAGIDTDTLSIPGIIHSTFLRFYEVPETPGVQVQESFQKYVKDEIATFFPDSIYVPHAKLVCERTPYMHIEDDEHHVLATFPFEQ